ncbi:hypothetical protein LAZ67_20002509 [Cordylochernes scorpioides]|uniref:Transposable element Tc3 transposase n=1 Tax=Cordylochernes scorpioides TaxID=51811 RepID=A0ABY6LKV1_9ARAC|nr:hypothetical protein LAZ67_20002509 [Cordylochernes scorpioides]
MGYILFPLYLSKEKDNCDKDANIELLVDYNRCDAKIGCKNFSFMQDGAPANYSNIVRTFLNEKFPHKWMGRGGPIDWPVQSPELTLAEFFLWGYLEDKVYHRKPKTLEQMKITLEEEINLLDTYFYVLMFVSKCP